VKTLFLQAEEAFFSGNHAQASRLKSILTATTMMMELKYQNPIKIESVVRVFMTSNDAHVVSVSSDARRFFPLEIASTYQMPRNKAENPEQVRISREYFERLHAVDRGALLYDLMNWDLTGFNVREVPSTDALIKQIERSFRDVERWWFDNLRKGRIDLEFDEVLDWEGGPIEIERRRLYQSYEMWKSRQRYDGGQQDEGEFHRIIDGMVTRDTIRRRANDGERRRASVIPPLRKCREEFNRRKSLDIVWTETEIGDLL
jgi:hypothetical protein